MPYNYVSPTKQGTYNSSAHQGCEFSMTSAQGALSLQSQPNSITLKKYSSSNRLAKSRRNPRGLFIGSNAAHAIDGIQQMNYNSTRNSIKDYEAVINKA